MAKVKEKSLPESEIVLDCSDHQALISALKPLVGKSGWIKIFNLTVEALEAEDHIIIAAVDEQGNAIDADIARKFFSLSAEISPAGFSMGEARQWLKDLEGVMTQDVLLKIAERNTKFFDNEVEKLDKWAEDIKESLELELKKLSKDIKTFKTEARKILKLDEKVKAQRQIKDMEKKRNAMRLNLFKLQDEADERKEGLITEIEGRLRQKIQITELFKLKWIIS